MIAGLFSGQVRCERRGSNFSTRTHLFILGLFVLVACHWPCWARADEPILEIDTGGHMAKIKDVIFTQVGDYLVSASNDKTVRVWDVATGECVRILRGQIGKGNEGKIYAAALSPDDRVLAIGGYLRTYTGIKAREEEEANIIRLIDFRTGEVKALLKGHDNVILALAFSPDGRKLISGSSDDTANIWDLRTAEILHELKGHTDDIYAVALSPDGKRAVTGSDDHTLKLWNVSTGSRISTMSGHTDKVKSAAFTPDGRYILSGSWDRTIRLWDGRSGGFVKVLAKQNARVSGLSISPDETKVVTGCGGGTKTNNVFSIPSGDKVTSFSQHRNIVLATAISPDGKIAATGGGDDNEIFLWDTGTGNTKRKLVGKGKTIWSVGFARDGRSIAWGKTFKRGGDDMYQIWGPLEQGFQLRGEGRDLELAMGREVEGDAEYARAIESAGPLSLRTQDGKVHPTLEILKNGRVIHEITRDSTSGHRHISFTLTPDGRTVISGGGNGVLTSYDPNSGKKIHDFIGHTSDVWAVAASPDSRWLVSGSRDQTVRLWEIETGRLLLSIFQGTDGEWVAWTPAGYYTSSVNGDNYIGWHINQGADRAALFYPASRFSRKFYSPEITARYIETGGDLEEAIRLVNASRPERKKIQETKVSDIETLLPPVVFFQLPAERNLTVTGTSIRVKAGAKSNTDEPIEDIWLLVNGRPLHKERGVQVAEKQKKSIDGLRAELDVHIPLTQTENRISVIASNRHGRSEPETIYVTREKGKKGGARARIEDIYRPDLYLLSIGVSDYQSREYKLDFAHKDALEMAKVLKRQKGGLYGKVHTRLLTDRDANQDNILDGLDWIMKETTQKDVAVIFVAGHGLKDDRGNYYFLPTDGNPEKLFRTGILWFRFQDVISNLPSKVVFLVDTCHAGSVTGKKRGQADLTDALRELMNTGSGVVVMAASTGKEDSQERKEWGHGAFTKALIEGLNGRADHNKDRTIDIKELDLYVTQRVKELTDGAQHPTTEIPKIMPNFPVVVR